MSGFIGVRSNPAPRVIVNDLDRLQHHILKTRPTVDPGAGPFANIGKGPRLNEDAGLAEDTQRAIHVVVAGEQNFSSGAIKYTIVDKASPIMKGMPDFEINDEAFFKICERLRALAQKR